MSGITKDEEKEMHQHYPTMKDGETIAKCTSCRKWHPTWAMRVINGGLDHWCIKCIYKNKK